MTRVSAFPAPAMIAAFLLSIAPVHAADVQVVDGATLVLDGRKICLWAVETPAAGETCTTSAGRVWPCGDRARDQVRALVKEDAISCQPKAPGFEVCRIVGMDIGLLLIKEGLAKARGDYQEIEARAREARVGMWE